MTVTHFHHQPHIIVDNKANANAKAAQIAVQIFKY